LSPSNLLTRPLLLGAGPLSNTPSKSSRLLPPEVGGSGGATIAGVPLLMASRAVGGDALAGAAPSKSISKRFSAFASLTRNTDILPSGCTPHVKFATSFQEKSLNSGVSKVYRLVCSHSSCKQRFGSIQAEDDGLYAIPA